MAKKFSELDLLGLQDFADNDILAATDVGDILSRRLTFGDLKSYVASDLFGDGLLTPQTIIDAMNTFQATTRDYDNIEGHPGKPTDGLDADYLDGFSGSYYLDYENIQNAPEIPTELGQLDNTSGYLTFNTTLERIEYRRIVDGESDGVTTFTADFVPEGDENFYYTTARFLTDLDRELESRLAQKLTVFFDGSLNDNLIKCSANMVDFVANQSDQLDNVQFADNFNDGQTIRIYGANVDNSSIQDLDKDFGITQISANFFEPSGTTTHIIRYRIAEMSLINGNISTASDPVSIGVASRILGDGTEDLRPILNQFDDNYNISIRFSGTNPDKAILLYRAVESLGQLGDYKLYAVLGPKDLDNNVYIDYGTFDYVDWGPKSPVDNTFQEMIHVPLSPPAATIRGWADVTILDFGVDTAQNRIRFTPPIYGNNNQQVNISHNDTAKIQENGIDTFRQLGRSALTLNDKTYVVSTIELPENFTIKGTPGMTKLIKLPWSSHAISGDATNNMIRVKQSENNSNINLQDIEIDGSAQYQVYALDNAVPQNNYTINFGNNSDTCLTSNIKASNIVGGGIWCESGTDTRINLTEFKDSGTTDRTDWSPVKASETVNLMITNSRFSNFSDSLDASVSTKGLITNNVVSNCGSGILVYGSSFLITNPNVILGPSNELLQSADALNSVFDSVNIRLNEGQQYESDVYRYQENGANYDLTADNGELTFLIYKLEKNSIGVENLYEEVNGPFGTDPVTYMQPVYDVNIQGEDGLFKFKITADNVTDFLNTYEYDALKADNANHVGMVYAVNLQSEHFAGDILDGDISPSNSYTYIVNLQNYENIAIGDTVRILQHQDFSVGEGISQKALVTNIIEDIVTQTLSVTLQYETAATIQPGLDDTGVIYLYKNTTIVKGRVI